MKFSRNYFPLVWGNYILKSNNYEIKTSSTSLSTYPTSKEPYFFLIYICLYHFHSGFVAAKRMT